MPSILTKVLKAFTDEDAIEKAHEKVVQIYSEYRTEVVKEQGEFHLSRTFLVEIILIYIDILMIQTEDYYSFAEAMQHLIETAFKPFTNDQS